MSDREQDDRDEMAKAEALRRALADVHEPDAPKATEGAPADEPADADGLAERVASLRAAHAPGELSPEDHEEILARALPAAKTRSGGGRVIRVTFGVVSALAIAAALILYLRPAKEGATSDAPIAWARSRSTTPLFSEPWKRGESTARIDRIALAREHDFRENRFSARIPERSRGHTR